MPHSSQTLITLFAGQVRSLAYDNIVNLHKVTKCRNFATLPMTENISQKDETFSESNKPPSTHIVYGSLGFFIYVIWGEVSHVTSPSLWEILNLLILQHK